MWGGGMASGGRVARETVGRAAGDSSDYFLFLILGICHPRRARGRAEKRRAGRRTGEKTHRGEYRGHIARWEGRSPHESRPGEGPARYDGHAPCTSVQATETERRPKGSRGSARSRPETAATSGSEELERGVGPSTALSLRARSVRRGVTARLLAVFPAPRRRRHRGGAGKAHSSYRTIRRARGTATVREPKNAPE